MARIPRLAGAFGSGIDAGGLLGSGIGGALVSSMNWLGGIIFSLTVVLVCSVISTQVSFPDVLRILGAGASAASRRARTAVARWNERRRKEKVRLQLVTKHALRQSAGKYRQAGATQAGSSAPARPG